MNPIITYTKLGKQEHYYNEEQQLHRDNDKPAYVLYHRNGRVNIKEYYQNGKLHRHNNPARTIYDEEGKQIAVYYYIDGVLTFSDKDYIEGRVSSVHSYMSGKRSN